MTYTKGEWKAYCLGSEGYQVRRNNEGIPAAKAKEELRKRLTPIVERMGGSFETQRANAHLIAAAPAMYEALKILLTNHELGEYESQKQGLPRMIEARDIARQALAKAEGK